uniref:Uncharacterized protein n=1 Tax=Arundo donax TaxID=35708 RepID=A0A0A8ZB12_ARUDO
MNHLVRHYAGSFNYKNFGIFTGCTKIYKIATICSS